MICEIREICGDLALDINFQFEVVTIYFNSRQNALNVKRILEVDDSIPNVATVCDMQEVVRCRDCKHFRHYGKTSLFINGKNIKAGWCQRRIRYDEEYRITADDFCSYGERKEGAD